MQSEILPTGTVIFEPLYTDVRVPTAATGLSAGYDVCAYIRGREIVAYDAWNQVSRLDVSVQDFLVLAPHWRALVPLGFRATIPAGFEAQLRPRSGLALKEGLSVANAPGTVDADYIGEWAAILRNDSLKDIKIEHQQRVAQIVFARYERMAFNEGIVVQTTERVGGFGSTGQ